MALSVYRIGGIARSVSARPLAVALGLSILVHGWLGSRLSLPSGLPALELRMPIVARLAPPTDLPREEEPVVSHPPISDAAVAAPTMSEREGNRRRASDPQTSKRTTMGDGRIGTAQEAGVERAKPGSTDPYYTAEELDVYPRLREPIRFMPDDGAALRVRLRVQVLLNEEGVVEEARFVEGDVSRATRDAAEAMLRAARFHPALKDGRPVKTRVVIGIDG